MRAAAVIVAALGCVWVVRDRGPPLPAAGRCATTHYARQGASASSSASSSSIRRAARSTTPAAGSSPSRSRSTRRTRCRRRSRTRRRRRAPPGAAPRSSTRASSPSAGARPRVRLGGAQARSAQVAAAMRALDLPGIYFLAGEQALLPDARAGGPGARLRRHRQPRARRPRAALRPRGRRAPGRRTVLRDARRGTVVSPRPRLRRARAGRRPLPDPRRHHPAHRRARAGEGGRERGARSAAARCFLDPRDRRRARHGHLPDVRPQPLRPTTRRRAGATAPIADAYEPGSTFKVVTAAAALDAGLVRPGRRLRLRDGRHHAPRRPHPRPQAVRPADLRAT